MDRIEDVDFDIDTVDGDYGEPVTQAWLILEGDFTDAIAAYNNAPEGSPEYCALILGIDRSMAEKLVDRISRYL